MRWQSECLVFGSDAHGSARAAFVRLSEVCDKEEAGGLAKRTSAAKWAEKKKSAVTPLYNTRPVSGRIEKKQKQSGARSSSIEG